MSGVGLALLAVLVAPVAPMVAVVAPLLLPGSPMSVAVGISVGLPEALPGGRGRC